MTLLLLIIFVTVRVMVIALAIFLGYKTVKSIIEPYVLRPSCLTDTNSCARMTIWKYENSFFAQVFPSGLFIWFNGTRLYVYGQSPGQCQDGADFASVDVISISGKDRAIVYHRQSYECIFKASKILDYYQSTLHSVPQTIYIRSGGDVQAVSVNVFDLFQRLVDEGIVSVNNIKKNNIYQPI